MNIEIFESCLENEKYSDYGINVIFEKSIPDIHVSIKFQNDGGRELFHVEMEWELLKNIIKRMDDQI